MPTNAISEKKTHNSTPTWIRKPSDLRIRHDIPNAINSSAGQEIIRQSRFMGGLYGLTSGLVVGLAGGITAATLTQPDFSINESIGLGAGIAGACTTAGTILGSVVNGKIARINLAEAELGIQNHKKFKV